MKSNLVSHVFIKNLSSVCTDKSTHRNVIQASKPPPPETYNEKKVNPPICPALVFKQMHPCGLVGRSVKYPKLDRPFLRRRPLFQSEAKCEAIDMKIIFYSHTNQTHYPRRVLHLASYWKWTFLELGNCPTATIKTFCVSGLLGILRLYHSVKRNSRHTTDKSCC